MYVLNIFVRSVDNELWKNNVIIMHVTTVQRRGISNHQQLDSIFNCFSG